nr:PREDICTED: AAA-ATPase At3g50940-like [Daucus carota subsp. sativus]
MSVMSLSALPSAASAYAAYASISSSFMLLKTTYHQIVPYEVHDYLISAVSRIFKKQATEENSSFILIIEKLDEYEYPNGLFESFEIYMADRATSVTNCLKILQTSMKSKHLTTKIAREETLTEFYQGIEITCKFLFRDNKAEEKNNPRVLSDDDPRVLSRGKQWFELSFEKIHKDIVVNSYIPFVMEEAEALQNSKKDLLIHSCNGAGGPWSPTILEHSSTFETLAMEPAAKKALMDDLDLFVKRREYFKRVGRAWKRGYLLYGPPGTGKSSLVAAVANYLKFDIYDLQLSNVNSDFMLRNVLMGIKNRSVLVIEDIDCSIALPDRSIPANSARPKQDPKITLSGLLNFIDGMWSSCGDERIIIFTTNHKDRLDPALLRPGRMDMHIHMSYLTMNGFKTLASPYLEINHQHWRFREIEELLGSVEATPAEVAEELMRTCDADACLRGLVNFLKDKKRKRTIVESGEDASPGAETTDGDDTTPGVELIPKAKKIKTNGLQDVFCHK